MIPVMFFTAIAFSNARNTSLIARRSLYLKNSGQFSDRGAVRESENQFVLAERALFPFGRVQPKAKPFLKWAGGKTRLLRILRRAVPNGFNRYFEPFLGGGALFFDLAPRVAILSDSNSDLILCYRVVRDSSEALLEQLTQLRVSETEFYRMRSTNPSSLSDIERAARFIYLNKTCYNGVYRVNKNGDFNTPFGHYKKVALVDPTNISRVSGALRGATLRSSDYQAVLLDAQPKDFIYLDPPYMPTGRYSDFKRYTKEFFHEADHERLAELFKSLVSRGCFVLLSNSYHERIAHLYSAFRQLKVQVPRFVNCKGEGRGAVTELLISNYEISRDAA